MISPVSTLPFIVQAKKTLIHFKYFYDYFRAIHIHSSMVNKLR